MEKTNKILSIILAILMVISIIPITASATTYSGTCGENLTWTFDESTGILTISGTGAMYDYDYDNRPWEDFQYEVKEVNIDDGATSVGTYAFCDHSEIEKITIPDSVTTIREYAFQLCSKLTSVIIPDSTTTIEGWAFLRCTNLIDVKIGENVTTIGKYAFARCTELVSVTIPDSVTTIGVGAFSECTNFTDVVLGKNITTINEETFYNCINLSNIVIDENVTTIGNMAFTYCANLKTIYYSGTPAQWNEIAVGTRNESLLNAIIHCDFNSGDFAYSVVSETDKTIMITGYNVLGPVQEIIIPSTIDGYTVVAIDGYVFKDIDTLTHLQLPNTLKTIGKYAFSSCNNLKDLVMPDSVTTIGNRAFYACDALETVTFGINLESIGNKAFYRCDKMTDVYYKGTETQWDVISIGTDNSPIELATKHFEYKLGDKPDKIVTGTCGENAIWEFNETTRTLTISGEGPMTNYTYVVLNNTSKIDKRPWASYANLIEFVVINEGITHISNYAFTSFDFLTIITIPESVTNIGKNAFASTEPLVIHYKGTESQWKKVTIGGENTGLYHERARFYFVNFPVSDCGKCGENITWSFDVETLTLTLSGTGTMYNDLGYYRDDLTKKRFDGERGWDYYKYHIEKIIITDGVTSISENAFNYHPNLKEIIIPDTVTELHLNAFKNCYSLSDVYYSGTENDWNNIKIVKNLFDNSNYSLGNATIHYNSTGPHTHDYESVVTPPTCTEQGYTAYTCECGDSYVADYVDAIGHNYSSEITTPATHTTTGIETFTCNCGDSYTEVIAKLEKHNYESVVTAPTCTAQGYTTYTCECGDSYVDDYVDAKGHNHTSEITTPATHTTTGVMTYTCSCGDTYIETIEKIEKHNYESVVTAPTCTAQGYTTYTCECGDTYVDDYVDALSHTEEIVPAVAPTCTETGLTVGTKCSVCGETLTEQKELPANGHTPATAVEENYITPTCTENGSKDVVIYCSVCNEEISRETVEIDATGHADNDDDGYCDSDNELLDPTVECNHNCHKKGIAGFFWRITNFFNKLFKTKQYCECGAAHY